MEFSDRFFISRKGTEEEQSDAFGGLRLRTVKILQAIAFLSHTENTESEESDAFSTRRTRVRRATLGEATPTPTLSEIDILLLLLQPSH
ncbi:MAG: hypothetical protein HWQ41_10290 [Nostoc sp. NOS(2021)]|uniref:hypothetical protein n=1 Tax=Nostoc sp. NOS(2021) TaxID=2815407 RepID=UPI0025D95455|nr:hypothetical protein [Nostoc sp. NOS(2021)]MBN3895634.1 hypothetical protein [Nostoc sp. NOS(2021)]